MDTKVLLSSLIIEQSIMWRKNSRVGPFAVNHPSKSFNKNSAVLRIKAVNLHRITPRIDSTLLFAR